MIAPTGLSVAELFGSQIAGRSGVGPITVFDASTFPTRIAAEVTGFDPARLIPNRDRYRYCDRGALFAAWPRLIQSVAQPDSCRVKAIPRGGVYVATESGGNFPSLVLSGAHGVTESGSVDTARFFRGTAATRFHPGEEMEHESYRLGGYMAEAFEFDGPNLACQTACARRSGDWRIGGTDPRRGSGCDARRRFAEHD